MRRADPKPPLSVVLTESSPAERVEPRLGMVQRVRVARRVAVARASPEKLTWAQLSEQEGLPERTLQRLYSQYVAEGEQLGDPLGVVRETLQLYSEAMEDLSETARSADGTNGKVGAIRLLLETANARIELMIAAGLMPRELYKFADHQDAVELISTMAKVVEAHDLGGEVIDELLAAIDGFAEKPPAFLSR